MALPGRLDELCTEDGGYRIVEKRHAGAILGTDYPVIVNELAESLLPLRISYSEVIAGGGGKSPITKKLEAQFNEHSWAKKNFDYRLIVDGESRKSRSHEIDHFRAVPRLPGIALEIEWNNKDPFYDRDLETFARLHDLNLISVGIMVTRGPGMQDALHEAFRQHYARLGDRELEREVEQVNKAGRRTQLGKMADSEVREALATDKFRSKFGQATTHWDKLLDRLDRGLGNPCPLLLVGIMPQRLVDSET